MTPITTRTLGDRMSGIRRMIRALANNPAEWEVEDLATLANLEFWIAHVRTLAVHGLRDQGITDGQIGEALGITQQAVSKRWPGGGRYVGAAGRYRRPSTPA